MHRPPLPHEMPLALASTESGGKIKSLKNPNDPIWYRTFKLVAQCAN
jgi:hypothetical protein